MGKHTVKISSGMLTEDIIGDILCEGFCPVSEMVLMVRDFLDKGFRKELQDDIDVNGYPRKKCVVSMLSSDGAALRMLSMEELLLLLDDKFNGLIRDDADRRKFLKQVIRDWFDGRITRQGLLSVNLI